MYRDCRRTPHLFLIMTVQETLRDLVVIDSVSDRWKGEITSYLARRCEAVGFKVTSLPYIDAGGVQKTNLVAQTSVPGSATRGGEIVELALVGHTDTVPYDPIWVEALRLTENNGKLFGRGACDTKAFITAR